MALCKAKQQKSQARELSTMEENFDTAKERGLHKIAASPCWSLTVFTVNRLAMVPLLNKSLHSGQWIAPK